MSFPATRAESVTTTTHTSSDRPRGVDKRGRKFGRRPNPYTPPQVPQGKINTTDPDSRNVKTLRGWVQGYNAQAASNEEQIVLAAELTNSSADFGQLGPMVDAIDRELHTAGVTDVPEVVLADAGYWHNVQMQALAGDGITVLVSPDAKKRKGTRPGWDGELFAFMRRALATPAGAELYGKRTRMSSPSLPTPSSTAASIASTATAEPPVPRNGA